MAVDRSIHVVIISRNGADVIGRIERDAQSLDRIGQLPVVEISQRQPR
jgi:hypothetical protein